MIALDTCLVAGAWILACLRLSASHVGCRLLAFAASPVLPPLPCLPAVVPGNPLDDVKLLAGTVSAA